MEVSFRLKWEPEKGYVAYITIEGDEVVIEALKGTLELLGDMRRMLRESKT